MTLQQIEIYQMTADRIKQTAQIADPDHPMRLFDRLMRAWNEANSRDQVIFVRVGYHWLQWRYVDRLSLDDHVLMDQLKDHQNWRRPQIGGVNRANH